MLWGRPGVLEHADALNGLGALRDLCVSSSFGMAADDVLDPGRVVHLERLELHNVPAVYADATRSRWRGQIRYGTALSITGARKPEWIEENRDNPLRDWDRRYLIGRTMFNKAVAQYRATKRDVLKAVRELPADELGPALVLIGRTYGEAFNRLSARSAFIETEEREDLVLALDGILAQAEFGLGRDLTLERGGTLRALDEVRAW